MLGDESVRLLFVAPERFDPKIARGSDVARVRALRPSYLVIDEAHLVDQWGRDFRPNYGRLKEVRTALGDPPVLAFTATAGKDRQQRIKDSLGISNAATLVTGTDRPNIALLRVQRSRFSGPDMIWMKDRARMIKGLVDNLSSGRALIFVPTTNMGKQLRMELALIGLELDIYHGQLNAEERGKLTEDFLSSDSEVPPALITTSAFSLGIDIPDVRLVVHLQHPASVEEYLQEFGRAGRDGQPATAVLFSDPRSDGGLLAWMAKKTIQGAVEKGTITTQDALQVAQVRELERQAIGALACMEGLPSPSGGKSRRTGIRRKPTAPCFRSSLASALGGSMQAVSDPIAIRIIRRVFSSKDSISDGVGCCDICNPELSLKVQGGTYDAAAAKAS